MGAHHHHGHHGHHHHHHDLDGKPLIWSIFINLFITSAQIVGGLFSGSLALLSDATHNLSDVIALILTYVAKQLSSKKATLNYTFGYKRIEILATLINSVVLIVVSIGLFAEASSRLMKPTPVDGTIVIALATLGILGNGLSVLLLAADAKESMNMRSAYLHMLTDMLTSVGVLAGGLSMYFFDTPYVDSILTIFIAIYLFYSSMILTIESLKILMQRAPTYLDLPKLLAALCELPCVKNIHHVHAWELVDNYAYIELHAELNENISIKDCTALKKEMMKICELECSKIRHLTVQFEFEPQCDTQKSIDH